MDSLPDKIRQQFLTWSLQKSTSTDDLDRITNVCIDSIRHVSSVLRKIAQKNSNTWSDEEMATFENSKRCLKHILFLVASEKQIDRSPKFNEKILDIVAALSSAYWDVLFLQSTRCAIADEKFENAIGACFHFLDCSISHTMDAFLQCESIDESPDSPPNELVKIYLGKLRDQLKIDKSESISKSTFLKGVLIYQKAGRSIGCGRKVEKSLKKVLLKRHRSIAEETIQWIRDTCGEILGEDLLEEFTIDRLFDSNLMTAKNCDALLTALTGITSLDKPDGTPSSPAPLRTVISEIEEALERSDEPMEIDQRPENRDVVDTVRGESMPNDDTSSDDFGTSMKKINRSNRSTKKSIDPKPITTTSIDSPQIHFLRSPSYSPTLSRVLRSKVKSISKRLACRDEGESESTSVVSESPRKKRSEKLIHYESSLDAASSPEPKSNQSRRSKRNSTTTMDDEPIAEEVQESSTDTSTSRRLVIDLDSSQSRRRTRSSTSQGSTTFDYESLLIPPSGNDLETSTTIPKTPIDGSTSTSKRDRSIGEESKIGKPPKKTPGKKSKIGGAKSKTPVKNRSSVIGASTDGDLIDLQSPMVDSTTPKKRRSKEADTPAKNRYRPAIDHEINRSAAKKSAEKAVNKSINRVVLLDDMYGFPSEDTSIDRSPSKIIGKVSPSKSIGKSATKSMDKSAGKSTLAKDLSEDLSIDRSPSKIIDKISTHEERSPAKSIEKTTSTSIGSLATKTMDKSPGKLAEKMTPKSIEKSATKSTGKSALATPSTKKSSTTRPLTRRRLIGPTALSDGQESSSIKKIGAQKSQSIGGNRSSPIKTGDQPSSEKTGSQKSPSDKIRSQKSPSISGAQKSPSTSGKQSSPAKTPIQRSPADKTKNRSPSPDDSRRQKKRPASKIPIAAAGRPKKKRGADVELVEEAKKEHIAMTPGYNTRTRIQTPAARK